MDEAIEVEYKVKDNPNRRKEKDMSSRMEGLFKEAKKEGVKLKESFKGKIGELEDRFGLRENVVMVRIDDESLARLDELVDAGLVGSRSEAAAAMITAGIKSRSALFEQIAERVAKIREMKEELKGLLKEEPN